MALWTLIESNTIIVEELNQYLIFASDGHLSCPIKLTDLKNEQMPVPVVFSDLNQLICITLKEYENQYIITISNQWHPQLVFYNYYSTTLIISENSKYTQPVQFMADWNWSYTIAPNNISYLSFPHLILSNNPTIYVMIDKQSNTGIHVQI